MRKQLAFAQFGAAVRRIGALVLGLVMCTLGLGLSAYARQGTFVTFDAPGAGTVSSPACAPDCGTFAHGNNAEGEIVGFYTDTNIVPHGFLRAPNGNVVSFDAPGAGLGHGLDQGTYAFSINNLGVIAGYFQDSSNVFHGFVRYRDGSFTTFDAPGAGTNGEDYQGTFAMAINAAGEVPGYYQDSKNVFHGFVRYRDGALTTFDAPGAGTGPGQGTAAFKLNPAKAITGIFLDANTAMHGFVRFRDGSFATFDAPGAGTGPYPQGTRPEAINPAGALAGFYLDGSNVGHGFLRTP